MPRQIEALPSLDPDIPPADEHKPAEGKEKTAPRRLRNDAKGNKRGLISLITRLVRERDDLKVGTDPAILANLGNTERGARLALAEMLEKERLASAEGGDESNDEETETKALEFLRRRGWTCER